VKRLLFVIAISLLFCTSCGSDDAVDPQRPPGSPPQIADLDCEPSSAIVDENGGAITVECTVNFEDADMDLETIFVRFRPNCWRGSWQKVPKDVISQTAGRTQGPILFDFIAETNCEPNNYPYEISAEDGTSRVSNVLTLQFLLEEAAP
jgi:hypothetical protein